MKSLADIDFNAKGGAKNSNETIDYSQSAEPTLNVLKEDTLKEHISYLAKGVNWIKENLGSNSIIESTYAELKTLKNNNQLEIGKYYIITDFVTTCAANGAPSGCEINGKAVTVTTSSAGHAFDLIVCADSTNTFFPQARARIHEGDTYFANSNLGVWELLYDFNNTTSKYAWAVSSGKGVIYYMKDEFNNECGYDFKNIQYSRNIAQITKDYIIRADTPLYTFVSYNSNKNTDASLKNFCFNNKIDYFINSMTYYLPHNILWNLNIALYFNTDCNIRMGSKHNVISFTNSGEKNIIGAYCYNNNINGSNIQIENSRYNINLLGFNVIIGKESYDINVKNSISNSKFGINNHNLKFSDTIVDSVFGSNVNTITLYGGIYSCEFKRNVNNIKVTNDATGTSNLVVSLNNCIFEAGVNNINLYGSLGGKKINNLQILLSASNNNFNVPTKYLNYTNKLIAKTLDDGTPFFGEENKITVNGKEIESGFVGNLDATPLEVDVLPVTANDMEQVILKDRTYTWYNDQWNCIADDLGGKPDIHTQLFVFQPTAKDLSIKDDNAKIVQIQGGTYLYNQLIQDTIYDTISVPESLTVERSSSSIKVTIPAGVSGEQLIQQTNVLSSNVREYYCFRYQIKSNKEFKISFGHPYKFVSCSIKGDNQYHCFGFLVNLSNPAIFKGPIQFKCNNYTKDTIFEIKGIEIFHISEMFKHIGVIPTYEEFNTLFPFNISYPYQPYENPIIKSLQISNIKSIGFNQFDGEKAKVIANQKYYLNGDYTYLGFQQDKNSNVVVFDLPSNRIYTPNYNGYIVAKGENICINLSHTGYRNGEYLPYEEFILSFDFIKTIKGSNNKVLFTNGELRSIGGIYDEIRYFSDINGTYYKATKHIEKRNYQTGDEDLENIITDGVITFYVLDTPIESENIEIDLSYKTWDFGVEELLSDAEMTLPIRILTQYGFNAVDEIRNNRFSINDLKKKVQELSSNNDDGNNPLTITAGGETLVEYSPLVPATLELSKIASSGSYEDLSDKPSIQSPIEDLTTIRNNATNGNTAYGWGNHADAGYAIQSEVTQELKHTYNKLLNEIPTELPPTDNSVTTTKIADASISTSKIQDSAIIGSKIGYQEITTDHIVNNAITNAKLEKKTVSFNGTTISLGGKGQMLGLVTANGYRCFLEITNNEMVLLAPTFAENGSMADITEIVRYPLLTELPTIPNPTANATEITDVNRWFNPTIDKYLIPEDLMYSLLSGEISMSAMLNVGDANYTLTAYNVDCKTWEVDIKTLISNLINTGGYEVYVENDIDSITQTMCSIVFKINNSNIIIECYKKYSV